MGENGLKLANEDHSEHQHAMELLYNLESLTPEQPDFHTTMTQVMEHLKPPNDSEEKNDLPELEKLREARMLPLSSAGRRSLFLQGPIPSAPNKPPFETLVGFLAVPMDKLKDMFAKLSTEEMKEEAEKHEH